MKFMFAILAVLATASTMNALTIPDFGKGQLHEDLQDFLKLLPVDDIASIVLEYAAEDEEFQAALAYVQSEAFQQLAVDVETIPEIIDLMQYLEDAGVEIHMLVNKLNEWLGIEHRVPQFYNKMSLLKITGGLRGLVKDIMAVVPVDKVKALYNEKLENSKAFANFIHQLQSPEFQKIVNTVYANPRFQELLQNAKAAGLDLSVLKDLLVKLLGIQIPSNPALFASSELEADFREFLALVPVEKVVEILTRYIAEDEQVQKALEYAYSQEFKDMVLAVEALKEYQELVLYLDNAGVNVIKYIQAVHDMLGMDDYVPPKPVYFTYAQATGGIRGMINELKAVLPTAEIKALYHKKLETSKAFADFIAHIQSDSFQRIVDSLYNHQVYLDMVEAARNAGFDVEAIAEFFNAIFGIEFPGH